MSLLDMIGPVMIGPSSSHTAGACRIGMVARALLGSPPTYAAIGLHASFAKTGKGHGTHLALVAGLLGFAPDDARLPQAMQEAQAAGLEVAFQDVDLGDVHPNTAQLTVTAQDGSQIVMTASSTGGGVIDVIRVNGFRVSFSGGAPTLLLRYPDHLGVIARVATLIAADGVNIAALGCTREKRGGAALLVIELDSPLSDAALAFFGGWREVEWLRMLPSVMSSPEQGDGHGVPVTVGTTA
ncbi:L-serine ammonia-lyase, iron-sulfur-dependent subunit beta [Deinococcus ruber]|uniref:L-serine dehydratase n=1 Tax=Deinococcus ruber TaxID=1848197 RepID=A0A918BU72_9DEIO|nr:L-serine ammonia-lyase, iron-sulfur-dependent subunit beta [Deinococcus ruber]GGQ92521.1 L-serine dehydratase, iron-sulfur-dependent subunit beta [Deinococcus ruber]